MYRIYFNRKNEAPQIWSVDEGDQTSEINVRDWKLHKVVAGSGSDLSVKVNPDTPTAWIEVWFATMEVRNGVANFFHDPNWRKPPIEKVR